MEMDSTKYRPHGLAGSVAFHLLLLLALFLMIIGIPDPPLSERGGGGIELNYGTDAEGYGDNQTLEQSGVSSSESESFSSSNEQVVDASLTESATGTNESITSEDPESITLNESVEPKKNDKQVKTEKKTKESSQETSNTRDKSNSSPTSNQQTVNPNAVMAGNNNNGDKEGKTGDQGNPSGTLNSKALYGDPGKGGGTGGGDGTGDGTGKGSGASLDMAGWNWDFKPNVKDETNESGRIVFKIKINSEGDIVSISAIEKSVSPSLVKIYEREVMKLSFTKTDLTGTPPPFTEGKITFIIRSK